MRDKCMQLCDFYLWCRRGYITFPTDSDCKMFKYVYDFHTEFTIRPLIIHKTVPTPEELLCDAFTLHSLNMQHVLYAGVKESHLMDWMSGFRKSIFIIMAKDWSFKWIRMHDVLLMNLTKTSI